MKKGETEKKREREGGEMYRKMGERNVKKLCRMEYRKSKSKRKQKCGLARGRNRCTYKRGNLFVFPNCVYVLFSYSVRCFFCIIQFYHHHHHCSSFISIPIPGFLLFKVSHVLQGGGATTRQEEAVVPLVVSFSTVPVDHSMMLLLVLLLLLLLLLKSSLAYPLLLR